MPQLSEDVYCCLSSRTHSHLPTTSSCNMCIYKCYIIHIIFSYIMYMNLIIHISVPEYTAALGGRRRPRQDRRDARGGQSLRLCAWYRECLERKRLGYMLIWACAKVGCGMVTCGAMLCWHAWYNSEITYARAKEERAVKLTDVLQCTMFVVH